MPPINPLELPEIIERVGYFLPLWVRERTERCAEMTFKSQTFQACILVSKLWYQTLLPILWAEYDAEAMVDIPAHILAHHHSHLRTFCMQRSQRALDVGCTRLVDLSLSVETGDLANLRRLIRSNPGLKTLAWNGPNGSELLEVTDLARLPHLEHLTLSRWDVSRGRFPKALLPVSGSLKTLRIGWLLGLHEGGFFGQVPSEYGDESEDEEEEEEEADLLGEGAAAGGDAKDDGNDISTTFMLPLLESYTTATGPPYAPDPAEFVKYCPNLTRLDLTLLKDEETVDIKRISDSLRNHCPKLRAFAERGSIPQDDKETLIRSCAAGLSELTAMMSCVRESTIDAIAVHASTLETLGIFNPNKDDANLEHISQLPARCPQLKWLSVSVWNSPVSHRAILDALKTSSWKSHSLERLDLDIQTPHEEHSDDSPDMIPVTEIFKGGQPVMGWYYHPDDPSLSDGSDFCLVEAFVLGLFESLRGLKKLRMLTWSGCVFTRSSHRSSIMCDSIFFGSLSA